jgi:hypothetical protein
MCPEEEDEMWGQAVSERGKEGVPIRYVSRVGCGLDLGLCRIDAPGLLSYFFVSFPFLFLISYLFHTFCKFDSNQFKPLSKFF